MNATLLMRTGACASEVFQKRGLKKNGGIETSKITPKLLGQQKLVSDVGIVDDVKNKKKRCLPEKNDKYNDVVNPDSMLHQSEMIQTGSVVAVADEKCSELQNLPVDWSLKVKMRIVSESSLAWCVQLKTVEEARGVQSHTQGNRQWELPEDQKSAFHSCCFHWVFPSLPWVRLFPRIVDEHKISSNSISLSDHMIQALHTDWTESFTSVFHLLRSGICPYFYMCTHQFTVLFRGPGISGTTAVSALLTPTSRGFREALKNDGIKFSMQNLEERRPAGVLGNLDEESDNSPQDENESNGKDEAFSQDKDDEEEDVIDTDEGASVWLQSLGLDKKHFPSLEPNKVKLQREGFRRIDNRPESLVYVEGPEVQALFNFLLNCRSCTATSGSQAGIPPTILAPVAYKGATMKANKVKHSVAKQTDTAGNIKPAHVLEISGPILPHHVLNVSALLRENQENDLTLTFNTHEPSAALNIASKSACSGSDKTISESGLHPHVCTSLVEGHSLGGGSALKDVHCSKQGYTYT